MHSVRTLAGALVLLLLPTAPLAPVAGQETEAEQLSQDSVRQLISTYQELQGRVGEVQDSAIEANPELQTQQEEVQEAVNDAMVELDPALEEGLERLPELQQEAMEAQADQDTTRLRTLVQEGTQIQEAMNRAQARVMEQPEIQTILESFREDLLQAMVQIDPEIQDTLDRMEALGMRLQAIQGNGQGGPGGAGGPAG